MNVLAVFFSWNLIKRSFQEIPKLNEELLSKQKQLEKIESGELGIDKVWINITEMNKPRYKSVNSLSVALQYICFIYLMYQ